MAGRFQEAQKLLIELDEIMTAATFDTGPIPIKCMMKLMGLMPKNEHRLPMVPATPEQEQKLEAIVKRYSLFVKRTEIPG
jgi:4-hydroxy-tetrahydrodipicolinate synthase